MNSEPRGVICRGDYADALAALVVTARLPPGPGTPEERAFRQGYVAGLAAAAVAAGVVSNVALDRLLTEGGGRR